MKPGMIETNENCKEAPTMGGVSKSPLPEQPGSASPATVLVPVVVPTTTGSNSSTSVEGPVLAEATNKVAESKGGADAMSVEKTSASSGGGGGKKPRSKASAGADAAAVGGGSSSSSSTKGGLAVGDLVELTEDVTMPGVYHRKGTVARITKVNKDGTYDVMYVLVKAKISRLPGHLLQRSELMTKDEGSGQRSRPSRTRKPAQKFDASGSGTGATSGAEGGGDGEGDGASTNDNKEKVGKEDAPPKKEKPSAEELQSRELDKVISRIERHDRYGYFSESDGWTPRPGYTGPRTYDDLRDKCQEKAYFRSERYSWITGQVVSEGAASSSLDVSVDWDVFVKDVMDMFEEAMEVARADPEDDMEERGGLGFETKRMLDHAKGVLEQARAKEMKSVEDARKHERLSKMQENIHDFCHSGEWRKEPFAPRQYQKIDTYVPANIYSKAESDNYLRTHLDGFLGQPYNYDDTELSDKWMCTLAGDDSLASVKSNHKQFMEAQVHSVINHIIRQIQDRCHNRSGTLSRPEKIIGQHVEERPVWGIDAYTRRMIDMALDLSPLNTEAKKIHFIEKDPDKAHDILNALTAIENQERTLQAERQACAIIRQAIAHLGPEHFRIHPKGTGAICIMPEGIKAYEFVTEYLGELYPAWRWNEKEEAVQDACRELGLKPALPDFYNILLERPRTDDSGYGIAFVDASRKANLGSSLSHSCNSNCYTEVVGRNGKLTIAVVTDREIAYGEELTMDYCSYTDKKDEYFAAVCLCGSSVCRSSFLHFAGYDQFQKVLETNYGASKRFVHLLMAGIGKTLPKADQETLVKHGIRKAAFEGDDMPVWLARYTAEILRFVEFERRVLPYKLIEGLPDGQVANLAAADADARAVMEQRVQGLAQILSIIHYILAHQPPHSLSGPDGRTGIAFAPAPLRRLGPAEVLSYLWNGQDSVAKRVQTAAARHGLHFSRSLQGETPGILHKKAEISRLLKDLARLVTTTTVRERDEARDRLLELRKILIELDKIQGHKNRHLAAADMVLLVAHTDTFVQPHAFSLVTSPPIEVQARDMGQPVPRSRVIKKKASSMMNGTNGFRSSSPSTGGEEMMVGAAPAAFAQDMHAAVVSAPSSSHSNGKGGARKSNGVACGESMNGEKDVCGADEVVHVFTPRHEPDAIVNRLLQWFNQAQDFTRPELMGCCLLPDIEQVYAADAGYGKKERITLHGHMENKFSRMSPFPQSLRDALIGKKPLPLRGLPVYGSPLLDFELNYGWALGNVQDELEKELDIMTPKRQAELKLIERQQEKIRLNQWTGRGTGGAKKRKTGPPIAGTAPVEPVKKSPQKGEELPPAPPATWVQCDDPACLKWRRLPWFVEASDLPDPFYCRLNTWRPSEAKCEVPQEPWDDEEEATLQFSEGDFQDLKPGDWVDTYCEQNKVWYEAVVREREEGRVKVHFHLWSDKFDEWIEISAGRFAPHKSYTKATKDYVNRRKRAQRVSRRRGDDDDDDDDDDEDEEEADEEDGDRKKAKEEEDDEDLAGNDWSAEGGVRSSRRRRRKSAVLREQESNKGAKKMKAATAAAVPPPPPSSSVVTDDAVGKAEEKVHPEQQEQQQQQQEEASGETQMVTTP